MKRNFLAFLILMIQLSFAQDTKTAWDNTLNKNWPEGFIPTDIKSSVDGSMQKAFFYKSHQATAQPLIVSLHTWSGDYLQEDPLAKEVQLRDWNYIHPDFRGKNTKPDACGSDLAIADIEDAIQLAILNGNVDKNEVHIIGVSGGGYATLLLFMRLNYPAKSFSAWASISDLEDWYWECKGRNLKYANDLEGVTSNGKGFNLEEARKRSPMFMEYQPDLRKGAFLNIYAGVHDGYTGSVPITHSINMYNKLLGDIYPEQKNKLVTDSLKLVLLAKRMNPIPETNLVLDGRKIHLIRELPGLSLTIFEGGHEIIVPQALALIPVQNKKNIEKLNILTIGDSNAAAEIGWPNQLKKLLPFSTVVNKSISGNTIGFDNLDQEKLNTLKNIHRYLEEAFVELDTNSTIDYIFIGLGTNDTKRIFESRQKEVPQNMEKLIQKIKQWAGNHQKRIHKIVIITPPPIDEQKANIEKYGGGDGLIQKNNLQFRKVAKNNQADFLDVYTNLKTGISKKTIDGVHLTEGAQFQVADEIENYLNKK